MPAFTKVSEVAASVYRKLAAFFRVLLDKVEFKRLVLETPFCLCRGYLLSFEIEFFPNERPHSGLEPAEVLFGNRLWQFEIVVEPVFNGRADAELG